MRRVIHRHKNFWSQKSFCLSAAFSIFLLALSLFANYLANIYVALNASNNVSDLLLDNLPTLNVSLIFFEGFTLFLFFVILILIGEPKKMPFVVKSIALFILIRSVFIILTHTAMPPDHSSLDPYKIFLSITSGNDLFFSSHTGLPFLLALIFWDNKKLRLTFIAASIFFASIVLLGHLHYSIDVFAAFFITYSIFHIAQKIFSKDLELFLEEK